MYGWPFGISSDGDHGFNRVRFCCGEQERPNRLAGCCEHLRPAPAPGLAGASRCVATGRAGRAREQGAERREYTPPGASFAVDIPGILVLHYADLPESDVQNAQGIKFTRPLRTIVDLIEAGTVERSFIRQRSLNLSIVG